MKIVIAGAGEVGSHLAKMLCMEYHDVVVIDSEEERLKKLSESTDIIPICGSPLSIATLEKAGISRADLFVAVSPAQEQDMNILSALIAKRLGSKRVTARINNDEYLNPEYKLIFTEMGIDLLFYPEVVAAQEIVDLLEQAGTSEYMGFSGGKLQLVVLKLDEYAPILDKRIEEVSVGGDIPLFRTVAIARNGETIIPKSDTQFMLNDLAYVISRHEGVEQVLELSGKHDVKLKRLMIIGGGSIGKMVAERMEEQMDMVKLVESDISRCQELSETLKKTLIINGDVRNTDLLMEEEFHSMDAFVAVTGSSEINILSCMAAKRAGIKKTIAEVENIDYIKLAEGMGVDAVINKKLITAGRIFRFTMSSNVQSIKCLNGSDAEVLEYIAKPGSMITSDLIRYIKFPKDAIIGGAIRGSSSYIAQGDFQIKPYDRVVVFALPGALSRVGKFFA